MMLMNYILVKGRQWAESIDCWNQFPALEPGHARVYHERAGTDYLCEDFANSGDLKQPIS